MRSFIEAERDDLNMMEFMVKNGWTPIFSPSDIRGGRITPDNCPMDSVRYEKEGYSIHKHYRYESNSIHPGINDVVGFWARTGKDHATNDNIENLINLIPEDYVLPCGIGNGKL